MTISQVELRRSDTPRENVVDRRLYDAAVRHGIDATRRRAEAERAEGPLWTLTTATTLTPALLAAAATMREVGAPNWSSRHREGQRVIRQLSSGLVRLAHHALEVHASDNRYEPEAWISQTIELGATLAVEHDNDPRSLLQYQQYASGHLAYAIVALSSHRLAFADHLTQAQAVWLACYSCARR